MSKWPEEPTNLNEESPYSCAKKCMAQHAKHRRTREQPELRREENAICDTEENDRATVAKNQLAQLRQFTPIWGIEEPENRGVRANEEGLREPLIEMRGNGTFGNSSESPSTILTNDAYSEKHLNTNHIIPT